MFILLTLVKSKFTLFGPSYSLWTGHSHFTEFGEDTTINDPNSLLLIKIQEQDTDTVFYVFL